MALTKHDLQQISELFSELFAKHFVQAFEQVIVPYVDTKIDEVRGEMNEGFNSVYHEMREGFKSIRDEMDARFQAVNKKMNDNIASLHERIDDTHHLIGSYFERCTPKKDHQKLEKRVKRLELTSPSTA